MQGLLRLLERLATGLIATMDRGPLLRTLVLSGVTLAMLLPGLVTLPPTDRDESRYIQSSRQMLESGDLIDIRFQDAPRWKKPIGIYWLQAAAASVTGGAGAPVWAWRLPSLAGALGAVLLTAWALAPLIGPRASALAGLMLGTSVITVVEGHLAKTDAVLLLATVLAQGALARLWLEPVTRFDRRHLMFWGAVAAGILVKGPVILLPVGGTVVWMCIRDGRLAEIRRLRPLPGLGLVALLTLPWFVAIGLRSGGDFFAASLGRDFLGKLAEGQERHWGPPGYYLATIWGSFWPWAPLALLAAPLAWRLRRTDGTGFLLGWLMVVWLPLELAPTKLPHYILPALPALCGLVAAWVVMPVKAPAGPRRLWLCAGLFAMPGLVLGLAAILALPLVERHASVPATVAGITGLVCVAAAARALAERRMTAHVGGALAAALLLQTAMLGPVLPGLSTAFLSPRMAAAHAEFAACSPRPLVSTSYREPSLVVAGGTATMFVEEAAAARLLGSGDGWRVFIEDRDPGTLERFVSESGVPVQILATVSGFNYNRGAPTRQVLVARDGDPALAPCLAARAGAAR